MAKTAAQRAARKRRRQAKARRAKASVNISVKNGKRRGPIFVNSQPVKRRKLNKNKNRDGGLASKMMSFGADSSGLNKSVGFTNRSVVEQRFEPRMEKIANLTGTAAFTMAQALYLNPGNSTLFPIFSQEASVYEQYRCNLLRFWYRSTEYTASGSNVGAGLVLMSTNFDPDDAQFGSSSQMENYWHGTSDAPFAPSGKGVLCHDVLAGFKKNRGGALRDATLNNYYVNPAANTSAPTSQAAKFYDIGLFQLATEGNVVSSDKIGELWVEYSFTMIHPKQPEFPIGGSAIHVKLYADDATAASPLGLTAFTTGSQVSASATVSGTAPGSSLSVINMAGNLANYTSSTIGLNDSQDTVFQLPNASATWLVVLYWAGATAITTVPTLTPSGGATAVSQAAPAGNATIGFFTAAGTSATIWKVITSTATGAPTTSSNAVTVGGLATMTDGNLDIMISRLPTALVTLTAEDIKIEDSIEDLRDQVSQMKLWMNQYITASSLSSHAKRVEPDSESDSEMEKSIHLTKSMVSKLLGK